MRFELLRKKVLTYILNMFSIKKDKEKKINLTINPDNGGEDS